MWSYRSFVRIVVAWMDRISYVGKRVAHTHTHHPLPTRTARQRYGTQYDRYMHTDRAGQDRIIAKLVAIVPSSVKCRCHSNCVPWIGTWRKSHLIYLANVPRGKNMPSTVWIMFKIFNQLFYLIFTSPISPLNTIDRPKPFFSFRISVSKWDTLIISIICPNCRKFF